MHLRHQEGHDSPGHGRNRQGGSRAATAVEVLGWTLVGVLAGSAVYELALALRAGTGSLHAGHAVPGAAAVGEAAFLSMLVGAVLALASRRPGWSMAALAPAAASFLVAFFFTYDDYYAPDLRRYSDGGAAELRWIVVVALGGVAAGALARLCPRAGARVTACMLIVILLTAIVAGDGH